MFTYKISMFFKKDIKIHYQLLSLQDWVYETYSTMVFWVYIYIHTHTLASNFLSGTLLYKQPVRKVTITSNAPPQLNHSARLTF